MRRYVRNKLTVWFLTALWVFLYTAKIVHVHHDEACSETSAVAHHHHCNDCPVCQFTFSFCLETPAFDMAPVRTFICFTPAPVRKKLYTPCCRPVTPRAPPRLG